MSVCSELNDNYKLSKWHFPRSGFVQQSVNEAFGLIIIIVGLTFVSIFVALLELAGVDSAGNWQGRRFWR